MRRRLTEYVTEYGVEYTHGTSARIHVTIRVEYGVAYVTEYTNLHCEMKLHRILTK